MDDIRWILHTIEWLTLFILVLIQTERIVIRLDKLTAPKEK